MRFGLICSEFPPKTRRHQDMGYGAMRTCAADAGRVSGLGECAPDRSAPAKLPTGLACGNRAPVPGSACVAYASAHAAVVLCLTLPITRRLTVTSEFAYA